MKRSALLDRYRSLVGEVALTRIYHMAESLAGIHVLTINTTDRGGGVAELLHSLLPLMEELGIHHSWEVIPLDDASNRFTARLGDLLQGLSAGELPVEEQHAFLDALRNTAEAGQIVTKRADISFVHDFQLAPLALLFPELQPALWMCHVDTARPDPSAKVYIEQFLTAYRLCVFNTPFSILSGLPERKTHVITPTLDPFSEKNRELPRAEAQQALARCGIDQSRPLMTQVSRFSEWKNPRQVIDVYRLVKQQIPSIQVALVGALEAADDINAREVFADIRQYAGSDPDIHLLADPALVTHREVNAFQRYSSVILQRSRREGFGLTATEAMWKYQPVIGTSATGLRTQIVDGQNGYRADDTETCARYALKLLQDRDLWVRLGKQAHEQVKQKYLFPTMVEEYLQALIKVQKIEQTTDHL